MRFRPIALVLILAALALPLPTLAQSSIGAIAADIDAYWAGQFAAAGVPYSSPAVADVDGPLDTPCGTISPAVGPGAFCADNDTIYLVPGYFDPSDPQGNFALYTVLAHEWGHHVQLELGVDSGASKLRELQADCLAGAYLHSAEDRGVVNGGMVTQAVGMTAQAGDLSILPIDGPEHGSPAERGISLMDGYNGGPQGCGVL
ncbi:MAG TPA: neutral zinc metallopeptidase [Thermomicrobiales bacterium]|nr:neutral zinc metallopeptidase [Thermomicrobiales bacterium]